jgi:DNA uptake protein ComE-like DNA-binding protein
LWVLAFITVAAAFFALWTANTMELVRQQQQDIYDEIDIKSTQAGIIYLLTSRYMENRGIDLDGLPKRVNIVDFNASVTTAESSRLLFLDDTVYQGMGDTLFSLQDEGGLVSINSPSRQQLFNLLGLLGVASSERSSLIAKLEDYIDVDDLYRLNGAELSQYKKAGLSSPLNRSLFTSWELANVYDWGKQAGLWRDNRLPRMTNTVWRGIPNFNTAPETVLQTWPGIGANEAQQIIEARKLKPVRSLTDLSLVTGKQLAINPLETNFFPSRHVRLTIWSRGGRRFREIHIQLLPKATGNAPWVVDYQLDIPAIMDKTHEEPNLIESPVFSATGAAKEEG